MKRLLSITLLVMFFTFTSEAQNPERNKGLGIILGEPSGLSMAYWTSENSAFSSGAAWSFQEDERMHLHVDYLFYNFDVLNVNQGSMPLYFGLGGRLQFGTNETFGLRFPLGVAYHFENDPVEIFLEVVPGIDLVPDSGFFGNSGLGFRYYF